MSTPFSLAAHRAIVCGLVLTGTLQRVTVAEIQVQLIDGALCARGLLVSGDKSVPANFVIDLGQAAPLVLHKSTASLMQLAPAATVDVRLGEVSLSGVKWMPGELARLDELSREHSERLGQVPLVGVLGLAGLSDYLIEVDVGEGHLQLLPNTEQALSTQRSGGQQDLLSTELPFSQRQGVYRLDGLIPDDFPVRVRFSTALAFTMIDTITADLAESAGGEHFAVLLGPIDVTKFVALRPEELSGDDRLSTDILIGTDFLACFRTTIDARRQRIRFEQIRRPADHTAERAYYQARATGDADSVEAVISAHPGFSLSHEAAQQLLTLRLAEEPVHSDAFKRALALYLNALPENRRADACIRLADSLTATRHTDADQLSSTDLLAGMQWASADPNGVAVHHIRARLGHLDLIRGDLASARRQLLSAAFGLPRDPLVNLWLGQFYETTSKRARAWSRYVQSALDKSAPVEAITALDRLQRNAEFRKQVDVREAAEMLEGRIAEFHPPLRAVEDTTSASTRISLAELFICIDDAKSIGPELAFAGLAEYFEGTDVCFIQYHLSSPTPDPLTTRVGLDRAAHRGVTTAPAACFDGGRVLAEGASQRDAPRLFAAYRDASVAERPPEGWRLEADLHFTGDQLLGEIRVSGPAGANNCRLHLTLCEDILVVPGSNESMLHTRVARASLSGPDGLVIGIEPDQRVFAVNATIAEIDGQLDATLKQIEQERAVQFILRPTLVNPEQCSVVGFVESSNGQVLAARRWVPRTTELTTR